MVGMGPPGMRTDHGHTRKQSWHGIAIQAAVLLGLWHLLSGHWDVFHISIGIFSVLLVFLINSQINRLQFFQGDISEWEHIRYGRLFRFIPWLVREVVVGGLRVAYVVLHPRKPIDPHLLRFRVNIPELPARVILANSITLTPGTITIEVNHDEFLVHALTVDSSSSIIDGSLPKEVANLFSDSPNDVIFDVRVLNTPEGL